MKIRKELWFGFTIMGLILAGTAVMLLSADTITRGHLGPATDSRAGALSSNPKPKINAEKSENR